MNNIELIKSFDENEWMFERSSGYSGFRNKNSGEWLITSKWNIRKRLFVELEEKMKFLSDFRSQYLPLGEYPDCVLLEFLDKYFEPQVKDVYNFVDNQ